eukprot:PhM_4_TR11939/c0_g1_i1/m.35675/K11864/BRCC3, BRCC36; BRCA1/BRCA2-containing complex subunit 3
MSSQRRNKLTEVRITSEAVYACLTHALSLEREEIMGVLFGYVDKHTHDNGATAYVTGSKVLHRVDKRPDRVEISPESLLQAAAAAEELSITSGVATRIVGWYHSHPKITMLPSHVDLRSQGEYQYMDPTWVGLIVAVYGLDSAMSKKNRIRIHCFQSSHESDPHPLQDPYAGQHDRTGCWTRVEVPVFVVPRTEVRGKGQCLVSGVALCSALLQEERGAFESASASASPDQLPHVISVTTRARQDIVSTLLRPHVRDAENMIGVATKLRNVSLDDEIAAVESVLADVKKRVEEKKKQRQQAKSKKGEMCIGVITRESWRRSC